MFFPRVQGIALTTMKHCNKHRRLPEEAAYSTYLLSKKKKKRPECRLSKEAWRATMSVNYSHVTTIQWEDKTILNPSASDFKLIWML